VNVPRAWRSVDTLEPYGDLCFGYAKQSHDNPHEGRLRGGTCGACPQKAQATNGSVKEMAKYVTEEAKQQIGKVSETRTYEVERGAIRRFAEAVGDPNPLFNDEKLARKTRFGGMIAPPTFCRSLGAPILDVKLNMTQFRGLDGGSDWEYFEPIRPGDRITVQSKLADLRESEGRLGPMVFITTETTYTNQHGEVCAIQRATGIRY
jgi:acyl dehydratase